MESFFLFLLVFGNLFPYLAFIITETLYKFNLTIMTNVAIFTPTTDFISDDTTKKMASYVKAKYQELYSDVHWSKAPILETVCYHEAKNILNCIHVPSDAFKMNKAFLEAIILMGFDFLEEFQVEAWESMLLDLPLSKVDQLLTVEEITE